jgi:DNA-binding transcriptional MerR regulator
MKRLTGVEPVTLRAWERRYGVPRPGRGDGAYRLYSEREAAVVRWMYACVRAGLPASRAAALARPLFEPPVSASGADDALTRLQERLVRAAAALDRAELERGLSEGFAVLPVEDACQRLVVPFLERLGSAWQAAQLGVAAEHFASQVIRRRLLTLFDAAPEGSGAPILAGCPPGEDHELGGLVLALFLRRRGLNVLWLGADLPAAEWPGLARRQRPRLVCLSVAGPDGVAGARAVARALAGLPDGECPPLAIGGRAADDALRAETGALPVAGDALAAADQLATLLTRPTPRRPE